MDGKITDPEQIITLLNHDVALEHGAIYQYLQHAYAIGEAGVGAEIINIARSEMRHLKYFAGIIQELGGTVTLERPNVLVRASSAEEMMRLGAEAEADAVRQYAEQLSMIDHAGAQRVLERVIMDEQFHREQWLGFDQEVMEMALEASYPTQGAPKDPNLVTMLNQVFQEEYNHLLVYLRHYFQTSDWEAKDFFFENAYWRMKHMSLIADEIHENNADPEFLWAPHPIEGSLADRVAQSIGLEQEAEASYQRVLGCPIPHEVRNLFENALGHAKYQEGQMKLLRDLNAKPFQGAPGYAPLGGPFPQAPHHEAGPGRPPEELGAPSPHGTGMEHDAPSNPSAGLTVGSLIDHPNP